MTRLYEDLEQQLSKLNKGIGFMDKDAVLMHEIDLQMRIYTMFAVLGLMMVLLGVLL